MTRTRIAATLVAGLILIVWTAVDAVADQGEASAFVREVGEEALMLASDGALTEEERVDRYHILFEQSFDADAMSELVIGRHRDRLSEEELSEYRAVFGRYLVEVYGPQLANFMSARFAVTGERETREGLATVEARLASAPDEILHVRFKVRHAADGYRIVDVAVEGVSLIVVKRQEVASLLLRQGVEGMFAALRRQILLAEAR